jgi:hypothetical protein
MMLSVQLPWQTSGSIGDSRRAGQIAIVDKPITQNEDACTPEKVSQPNKAGSISLRHDRI